jgi:CheY-specific phosphatase CheX
MKSHRDMLRATVDAVSHHAQAHVAGALGLTLLGEPEVIEGEQALKLLDMTAIISLGGAANVLVAFTFETALSDQIRLIETQGLPMTPEEFAKCLPETLAETANIIAGHCTKDLERARHLVTMSTPVVIESRHLLCSAGRAHYKKVSYQTTLGKMQIICVAPRDCAQIVETEKLKFREGGRSV